MVTNYPHSVASENAIQDHGTDGPGVMDRVRQLLCGLHGHDTLLQFEQDRMFLRCVSCGHETPGWMIDEPRPSVTALGDARRHAMARPQLVSARRIA